METYKSWLNRQGKSEHTIHSYLNIVQNFQSWFLSHSLDDEFKPTDVTSEDVEKWKHYLLNEATYVADKTKRITKNYSVSTVRTYMKGLKNFFHFLVLTHVIPQNPAANANAVQVNHEQQDEGEIRWFTEGERSRLLHYLNESTFKKKNNWKSSRNKAIIYAGLFAGLRRSEIVHLELDDISFEKSSLHVWDDNGKSRHLPLGTELKKSLLEWLEHRGEQDHPYVFLSIRGGKLAEMGIHYLCETIGKKLNIDDLTPHVLRHSFAHEHLLQGMNLKPLATLLGHKNTNYTRLYKKQMKKNSFQKSKYKPGEPK